MSTQYEGHITQIHKILKKKGVYINLVTDTEDQWAQFGTPYVWDKSSKELTLIIPNFPTGKEKRELFKIIRKVHQEEGLFLRKDKLDTLDALVDYKTEKTHKKILDYFEYIIPHQDFLALKMALFLRIESEKGKNIQKYKQDIKNKFGDRGNNIANLCTAGYFDDEFQTIPNNDFMDYYERVVGEKARALFVHNRMNCDEIEIEVNKLVKKAKKYHMTDFRLHGKGKINVDEINKFAKSRTGKEPYKIIINYNDSKAIAVDYTVMINR